MTTVQKVTSALIEAGASTQDALESMHVARPACLDRVRGPQPMCMSCGRWVYFRQDRCPPCQARWRHARVITGQLPSPSQGPCPDCGIPVGTGGSCSRCYAHRTRERISAQSTRAGEAVPEQGMLRWADRLWGLDGQLVFQNRTTRQDTTDQTGVGVVVTGLNLNVARVDNGTAGLRFAN